MLYLINANITIVLFTSYFILKFLLTNLIEADIPVNFYLALNFFYSTEMASIFAFKYGKESI